MYKGIDTQKGIPLVCATRKLYSTKLLRYARRIWLYAYRCLAMPNCCLGPTPVTCPSLIRTEMEV